MTLLVVQTICLFIFVSKASCEEESWYTALNPEYTFSPIPGNCYEVHEQTERVTSLTCQKSADFKNYSCIKWISQYCLGLQTPTNETIKLHCRESEKEAPPSYPVIGLDNCFRVHAVDNTSETVCLNQFDNFSFGLTTPDNFTVLFFSTLCKTFVTTNEIKIYDNFVSNFSFDPEIRSCYKVFKPDQGISPYTCLNKDVYDACVQNFPKYGDCLGILTPNNETVLLECSNSSQKSERRNCFDIITADNEVHSSCQKKLEERCVGITTPSNLTILFECYFCSKDDGTLHPYSNPFRQEVQNFVDNILDMFKRLNYSFDEGSANVSFGRIHRLHEHNNCLGLTVPKSLETIIIECPGTKLQNPGCFDILSPKYGTNNETIGYEETVHTVCAELLDERCVGIITPSNQTLPIHCNIIFPIPESIADIKRNGPPPRM